MSDTTGKADQNTLNKDQTSQAKLRYKIGDLFFQFQVLRVLYKVGIVSKPNKMINISEGSSISEFLKDNGKENGREKINSRYTQKIQNNQGSFLYKFVPIGPINDKVILKSAIQIGMLIIKSRCLILWQ